MPAMVWMFHALSRLKVIHAMRQVDVERRKNEAGKSGGAARASRVSY